MSKHIEVIPNISLSGSSNINHNSDKRDESRDDYRDPRGESRNPRNTRGDSRNTRDTFEKPVDPDVELVLNIDDNLDIMGLNHKPTKEESTDENKNKPYSWLLIGLAILVIILIIAIVWYVLKDNKKDCLKIPDKILQPAIHPVHNFQHPLHPVNRPQMENLQANAKFMPSHSNTNPSNVKNPSKDELLKTLSKLNTIPEEPKIDEVLDQTLNKKEPKKTRTNEKIIKTQEQETNGEDEEDEQDVELAKKFYNTLQQNIENDEGDESDNDVDATD
jgi:hypothetical protein